jgi:hypothetical protein
VPPRLWDRILAAADERERRRRLEAGLTSIAAPAICAGRKLQRSLKVLYISFTVTAMTFAPGA